MKLNAFDLWRRLQFLWLGVCCVLFAGCGQNSSIPSGPHSPVPTSSTASGSQQQTTALSPPAEQLLPADYRGIDESDGRRNDPPSSPLAPAFPPHMPGQSTLPELEATASSRFACDLFASLRKSHAGNLFYSPANVRSALMLAYEGARGETAAQLARVLGIDSENKEVPGSPGQETQPTGPRSPATILVTANRIWPNQSEPIRTDYAERMKARFAADIVPLDFLHQSDAARQTINNWTAEQTRDRIRDLLQPGTVDASTRMVLTSAIYFKADWFSPFEKTQTENAPFFVSATEQVETPMMQQELSLPYIPLPGAQVVEVPYADARHSMLILLPDQPEGLAEWEARLTADQLANWTRNMHERQVRLSLPRFTMTVATSLAPTLKSLGINAAFQPDADFSGMTDAPGIFLADVVHKAFVSVDEQGTEAAAATALTMMRGPANLVIFRADRPFLFLIRDQATNEVLFVGRMSRPE